MRFVVASTMATLAVAAVFAQPSPPVSHEYANVNGQRLHYARAGSGPLIVFLHGFPEFWYEWKNQIAEFSRDHTVVAPDMRGYNLSSKPAEVSAYQMPNLVEDVRALASELMKTAGGTKFTLVAHDWGGVVAWVFAALHPEMLDKLVIVNAPHPTIFGKLLRMMHDEHTDPRDVEQELRSHGFLRDGVSIDLDALQAFLAPLAEPSRVESFAFSREWLRGEAGRVTDRRSANVARQLNLPPSYILIHRVSTAGIGVLCQLECEGRFRDEVLRWVPGYADAPARLAGPQESETRAG